MIRPQHNAEIVSIVSAMIDLAHRLDRVSMGLEQYPELPSLHGEYRFRHKLLIARLESRAREIDSCAEELGFALTDYRRGEI